MKLTDNQCKLVLKLAETYRRLECWDMVTVVDEQTKEIASIDALIADLQHVTKN